MATESELRIAEQRGPARRLLGVPPSLRLSFDRVGHIWAFIRAKLGHRQAPVASEGDSEAHPRIFWPGGEDLEVVPAPLDAPARQPQWAPCAGEPYATAGNRRPQLVAHSREQRLQTPILIA